jgi:hypothetical protein
MRYEQFKTAWDDAFRSSGLSAPFGFTENLDIASTSRTYEVFISPIGGFGSPPITVMGTLSWRWKALHTARAATTEEDMLAELFGRRDVRRPVTAQPWIRIDILLSATFDYGKEIPFPPPAVWEKWSREASTRLQTIEPLVPKKTVREGQDGLEVLAWAGEPKITAGCTSDGAIRLKAVEWTAWQGITLPRHFDDPDRRPDPLPNQQLIEMFRRVRASLQAWKEMTDHLV